MKFEKKPYLKIILGLTLTLELAHYYKHVLNHALIRLVSVLSSFGLRYMLCRNLARTNHNPHGNHRQNILIKYRNIFLATIRE